jgi:hypothetical protein
VGPAAAHLGCDALWEHLDEPPRVVRIVKGTRMVKALPPVGQGRIATPEDPEDEAVERAGASDELHLKRLVW